MEISYRVGEFDLTLDNLIEQIRLGKISIYDVPISEITNQFLEILREVAEQLQITDLSFFYRRVSELLYIKSEMLLPVRRIEFDDQEGDLRNRVIDALEKLKFSKYLALLERYKDEHSMDLSRFATSFILPFSDEDLLEGIRLNDLCVVYNKLLENAGEKKLLEWSLGSKINSNEKLALLLELFEKKNPVTFTELVVDLTSREHITSAFFAILNAINLKVCTFKQDAAFEEIYLYRREDADEEELEEDNYGIE